MAADKRKSLPPPLLTLLSLHTPKLTSGSDKVHRPRQGLVIVRVQTCRFRQGLDAWTGIGIEHRNFPTCTTIVAED